MNSPARSVSSGKLLAYRTTRCSSGKNVAGEHTTPLLYF